MLFEVMIFLVMVGVFVAISQWAKMPISVAMVSAAIAGALIAGEGLPIRHLVEGTFSYLSTIMVISTATIFMKVIQDSGALDAICSVIVEKFHNKPALLLLCIMLVVMFPGMITGSSTAAVLSAGSIMAPVLITMGMPALQTAAIIAIGAILGKVAPPVNIAAMLIGAGADTPFVGFTGPLLLLTLPLAVFSVLYLGYKHVKNIDYDAIKDKLNNEAREKYGLRLYIPIVVLLVLIALTKVFMVIPDSGMPIIFIISSVVGIFTGKKFNPLISAREAMSDVQPVMGNLMGVGAFVQIMTMTGVRGMIVTYCLIMPPLVRYLAMGTIIPMFGGVSSLGAATVFGIPFILAFLGNNTIIVASALSMLCAIGDIVPPSALAGNFAVRITGVKKYGEFLKVCAVPAIACILYGMAYLIFANQFGKLFGI